MKTHRILRLRRPARAALLIACGLTVAGFVSCRSERADWAKKDAGAIAGFTTAELRACAGRPNAERRSGTEWLYVAGDDRPTFGGRPPRFCEARVRFIDGAVADVRYGGATGALSGAGAECAPIFARC